MAHPVPLNNRAPLPCGCESERVDCGDRYEYIHYTKPDCQFDGKKMNHSRRGYLRVPFNADDAEIRRARSQVRW